MQIIKKQIDDLKAADYNPRKDLKQGDKEYEKLKRSIKEFGYVEPVIWNERTGTVVGGHQRLKVLKDLGYDEIDCVIVNLSIEQEKALNVALNKISGEWDNVLLGELLKDLEQNGFDITLTGFDLTEAKDLYGTGSMENVCEDNFNLEKEVKEIKEAKTKIGDIYYLGNHRLICGDSTNIAFYKQLLNGKVVDLIVTDPPYNIDYGGTISGNGRDITNDNLSDSEFYEFLLEFYKACFEVVKDGGPIYVFHSTKETVNFIKALIVAGFKYAQTLVWYKNHFTLGRQDYQWELVKVELDRRKILSLGYKCKSAFSSKLICSHCGSFYGQKVWHSTSKYRRLVYQCNDKFNKSHSKCQTPTLNEEDVITRFLNAYTTFMGDRGKVISNCRDMIKILDNSS